eukprot:scaffold169124_cov13-Prasinocladus_malaysianus.AAC.1
MSDVRLTTIAIRSRSGAFRMVAYYGLDFDCDGPHVLCGSERNVSAGSLAMTVPVTGWQPISIAVC